MAFHLTNITHKNGSIDDMIVRGSHWSVYLLLAQSFGWQPAGTQAPSGYNSSEPWHGQYDTNDGQTVTDADAKLLAQVLHAAVVSEHLNEALSNTIEHLEEQARNAGLTIPDAMRMKNEDFNDEFSPLLVFLYEGAFVIN